LVLGIQTEVFAEQARAPQEPSALSAAESEELTGLVRRFMPDVKVSDLAVLERRRLLIELRNYATPYIGFESERLVVCEVAGDPHLLVGDVIYLFRVGSSANLMMTVVRNEGTAQEMHPWKSPGGGNDIIIVNPAITAKMHSNAAYKKFTPEGVGGARVDPHTGGVPEDHAFSVRRNTRANYPNACDSQLGDEDMLITVPPQHVSGGRHGGHAVAN
jgi:hypothetical protein